MILQCVNQALMRIMINSPFERIFSYQRDDLRRFSQLRLHSGLLSWYVKIIVAIREGTSLHDENGVKRRKEQLYSELVFFQRFR